MNITAKPEKPHPRIGAVAKFQWSRSAPVPHNSNTTGLSKSFCASCIASIVSSQPFSLAAREATPKITASRSMLSASREFKRLLVDDQRVGHRTSRSPVMGIPSRCRRFLRAV